MNLTRLMVLGTLARHGPRHGHEIRRLAEVTNVGEWGGVSVGALYRELRTLEGEGLVEPLRTERVGRRPARTVYAITASGHLELSMLRERAVRSMYWGPDPLGVALSFAGATADVQELASWLHARRELYAINAAALAGDRERLVAQGYLGPLEAAVMYRGQLHCETEVRWHDEFAKILAALPAGALTGGMSPLGPGPAEPAGGRAPAPAGRPGGRAQAPAKGADGLAQAVTDEAGAGRTELTGEAGGGGRAVTNESAAAGTSGFHEARHRGPGRAGGTRVSLEPETRDIT